MTVTPTHDMPGFVADKPEHCFSCFRLVRPGQTYYLTIEQEVLCTDCALDERVIRVRDDLAVEVKQDRLLVRRGKAEVEVLPGEIRHLVDALVDGAADLAEVLAAGGCVSCLTTTCRNGTIRASGRGAAVPCWAACSWPSWWRGGGGGVRNSRQPQRLDAGDRPAVGCAAVCGGDEGVIK